jgi:DNA-binding transcriptional regulator YiaG
VYNCIDASLMHAIRTENGMTQPQFAKLIGVSFDTVVSWENGRIETVSARIVEQLVKLNLL